MSKEEKRKEIAEILKNEIHYVAQTGGFVVTGAIEKLLERESSAIRQAIEKYTIEIKNWLDGDMDLRYMSDVKNDFLKDYLRK